MTIIIDGVNADIKFENEKKFGEVISSLEEWACESGFCLSGMSADGMGAEDMEVLFNRNIQDINTLRIDTMPLAIPYAEALELLDAALHSWMSGEGREDAEARWLESPGAAFIERRDKQLSELLRGGFSDGAAAKAAVLVRERAVEAGNPVSAFLSMEDGLNENTARLLDLPLDLQTGNDRRAAETIERFSGFTQNLFRLFPLLKYAMAGKPGDGEVPVLFDEFKSALKEFLAAYENKDMVLCGDLAEYEIAPRIKTIYMVLKEKLTAGGRE
jgi:hypothetical protein